MKYFLSGIFSLIFITVQAIDLNEDLKYAYKLLDSDLDSAEIYTKELLISSIDGDDLFVQVQANYILGYISKEKKEYGVSVVYYLEAIRKAEGGNYEGVLKDRVSLRKNIANTFRIFGANELATKYNLEAIQISKEIDKKQMIDITFNQGLVYKNSNKYDLAINTFNKLIPLVDHEYKFRILNEIGLVYLDIEEYSKAKVYFDQLVKITPVDHSLHAKALHNLGEIDFENGNIKSSIEYLKEALSIMLENQGSNYDLFYTYWNLGTYLFYNDQFKEAEKYLISAINLIDYSNEEPRALEAFKITSDFYYQLGDNKKGKDYLNRYFTMSQMYIERQHEIQQRDKEFNFELITKRYFDDVEKQDRIASVMMYSKVSTGSLLLILILVISYYQLQRARLRKNIERELNELNVLS